MMRPQLSGELPLNTAKNRDSLALFVAFVPSNAVVLFPDSLQ